MHPSMRSSKMPTFLVLLALVAPSCTPRSTHLTMPLVASSPTIPVSTLAPQGEPLHATPSPGTSTPPAVPERIAAARTQLHWFRNRVADQELAASAPVIIDRLRSQSIQLEELSQNMEAAWSRGEVRVAEGLAQDALTMLNPRPASISVQGTTGFSADCPSCRILTEGTTTYLRVTNGEWTSSPEALPNGDFLLSARFMPLRIGEYGRGSVNLRLRQFYGVGSLGFGPLYAPGKSDYPDRYNLIALDFGTMPTWHNVCDFAPPVRNEWNVLTVRFQANTVVIGWAAGEVCHQDLPLGGYFGDIVFQGYEIILDRLDVTWLPMGS